MHPRILAGSVIAGLALAALLAWALAPRPLEVELAEAATGPFETSIDEEARTRVRDRYVVSAPLAGRLERLTLREGDRVEAGALLATLTPPMSPMLDARSLRQQQERIEAAAEVERRAGAQVDLARVGRERSELELRRSEQLAAQGFLAPTRIDADRLGARAARMELESAEHGRQLARHELQLARAALAAVRDGASDGGVALRAPVAGRVLKVHQASAATLPLGAPVIDIGDTTRLEVVAELLTSDALLAQPGSLVHIERWGGPAVLQGRVRGREPAAFTKVSALGVEEQRVRLLIDLVSPPGDWAALGDAYRVAVRIVTLREDKVLRVPISAVFPLPQAPGPAGSDGTLDARAAVFVLTDGRARLQPVTLGGRNTSWAWVRQGLDAGQKVIVYPPPAVGDGTRVRQRAT